MNDRSDGIPMTSPPSNALLSLAGRNASNSASIPSAASLPQNIFSTPPVQPSSVINLSNSSDVVIGPMTQYQGAVTIYQYMDATVEARAMHANGAIRQDNTTTTSNSFLQKATSNSGIILLLIVALIVATGLAVFFTLNKQTIHVGLNKRQILFGDNYESGTFPNLGNGHLVIDREQWGAGENYANGTLEHPTPYVLVTHSKSAPCFNVYKCSMKMRAFQDSAVAEKHLPDIGSNFYVGHDGNIYVGRGWDTVNTYANKSLGVTFIGDFTKYEPDKKQLEAVQYLLAYGLTNKYLSLDYKLVAQNQTKPGVSPGANVYKDIIKWPHWYPCGMPNRPVCGEDEGLPNVWNAKM